MTSLNLIDGDTLDHHLVDAVGTLAQAAAAPKELTPGGIYLVHNGNGTSDIHDLTGDEYRQYPARRTGDIRVDDIDSFAAYWAKHADAGSDIYADRDSRTITAVLDAHNGPGVDDGARWGQHRAVYTATYSHQFATWLDGNDMSMTQEAFAEFVEDNRADIFHPAAADMLEIVQTLEGTTRATWTAGIRLANGSRKLVWAEETDAKAGTGGDLAIPTELTLRMPVFDRAAVADEVTARFRYRITSGKLTLLYKLDRPTDVVTAAFEHLVADVADKTGHLVLRGAPVRRQR